MSETDCGCKIYPYGESIKFGIDYCPLHKAAGKLLMALHNLVVQSKTGYLDRHSVWKKLIQEGEAAIREAEGKVKVTCDGERCTEFIYIDLHAGPRDTYLARDSDIEKAVAREGWLVEDGHHYCWFCKEAKGEGK